MIANHPLAAWGRQGISLVWLPAVCCGDEGDGVLAGDQVHVHLAAGHLAWLPAYSLLTRWPGPRSRALEAHGLAGLDRSGGWFAVQGEDAEDGRVAVEAGAGSPLI